MNTEQIQNLKSVYKTLQQLKPKGQIGKAYDVVLSDIATIILQETL